MGSAGFAGFESGGGAPGVYTPYSFGLAHVAPFAIASPLRRLGWVGIHCVGWVASVLSNDGLNLDLWFFFAVGTPEESSQIFGVPLRTGALPLLASCVGGGAYSFNFR